MENKAAAAAKAGIVKGDRLGDKATAAARRRSRCWETRLGDRQGGSCNQGGNHELRQDCGTRRQPAAAATAAIMKEDEIGRQGSSGSEGGDHATGRQGWAWRRGWERRRQRQQRQQLGRQGWETRPQRRRRSRRETWLENKAAAAAESGDHEGRRHWETRRQRQRRRDHEGQGWETGQQAQKVAIMKGDKAGREGGLSGKRIRRSGSST